VHAELAGLLIDMDLILEPGRWIVGPAGLLLTRVILEKRGGTRRFVVLDAAMNDLMRPAVYGAWHGIIPVDAARYSDPPSPADIVGPVCETTDCFAKDRLLPDLREGDLLAILDAGAYGAVLSSAYNSRPRAGAAIVASGRALQACRRQSFDGMIADETWFRAGGGILPVRDVFDEFIAGK
jgi:diaminopimelate decarboxylase